MKAILTSDLIYAAFVEAKRESDASIKYYLITVALLLMAAARAIKTFPLLGVDISGPFIGPAGVLSFCVCTVVYTNHELKMRLFSAFFKSQLEATPNRAEILLRYPLAFYGGEFVAWAARPKGFVVGWEQVAAWLPVIGFAALGWLLGVFGLMGLVISAVYGVYIEPAIPVLVKYPVIVAFVGSMAFSGALLRNPKVEHYYSQ